jgi:hypothetical protein
LLLNRLHALEDLTTPDGSLGEDKFFETSDLDIALFGSVELDDARLVDTVVHPKLPEYGGSAMNIFRLFSVVLLAFVVLLGGCGSGQSYNPNNVTVTVSPATATIPASGKIRLQATVNSLCSGCAASIANWGITEDAETGDPSGFTCAWFTDNGPPTRQCPAGTIEETPGGPSSSLTVTYHAPPTPGTYHVIAQWSGGFGSGSPTKDGTAVITVTQ